MRHHADKVQALSWHPVDASVLLSASFDRKVTALDVRAPDATRSWALTADVESIAWNPRRRWRRAGPGRTPSLRRRWRGAAALTTPAPAASRAGAPVCPQQRAGLSLCWLRHLLLVSAAPRSTRRHDAHYFVASSEDGVVKYFDARQDKKAVFTLQAPRRSARTRLRPAHHLLRAASRALSPCEALPLTRCRRTTARQARSTSTRARAACSRPAAWTRKSSFGRSVRRAAWGA